MGNNEAGKLFQTNSSDETLEIKNVRSVTFNQDGVTPFGLLLPRKSLNFIGCNGKIMIDSE